MLRRTVYSVIFLVLVIVAVFAGYYFSKNKWRETTSVLNEYSEPVRIRMLFSHANVEFNTPTMFQEYIRDKFNVDMQYELVEPNNYNKVYALFASGLYPEFLPILYDSQLQAFRMKDWVIPVDDYLLKNMPNYRKLYNDEEWEYMLSLTEYQGKHYSIPVKNYRQTSRAWIYDKTKFDELKLPFPETIDDLYNSMLLIKGKYKDTILPNRWGGDCLSNFFMPYGVYGMYYVNSLSNELIFTYEMKEYREALIQARRFYKAGLLPPDFPTWIDWQWNYAFEQRSPAIYFGYASDPTDLVKKGIKGWALSTDFVIADKRSNIMFIKENPIFGFGAAITNKADSNQIKKIIEMLEWFSTDEGNDFTWLGPRGVTHDIIDGYYVFKDGYADLSLDKRGYVADTWLPFQREGFLLNVVKYSNYITYGQTSLGFGPAVEKEKSPHTYLWDSIKNKSKNMFYPKTFYVKDNAEAFLELKSAISNLAEKYQLSFIMSNDMDPADEPSWKLFTDDLKKAGYDSFKEILTNNYNRMHK